VELAGEAAIAYSAQRRSIRMSTDSGRYRRDLEQGLLNNRWWKDYQQSFEGLIVLAVYTALDPWPGCGNGSNR